MEQHVSSSNAETFAKVPGCSGAHASHAHLRCATDSSNERCPDAAPPVFDSYGKLSEVEEKQRLYNFVIALEDQKGSAGYIIAYGGERERLYAEIFTRTASFARVPGVLTAARRVSTVARRVLTWIRWVLTFARRVVTAARLLPTTARDVLTVAR
jgi:hypothetical protein